MSRPEKRIPDILLIGAMKSGTTTLCRDLMQHPQIFVPECKEVGDLRFDPVLTKDGRSSYADYYRFANPGQLCVDASTGYSRIPQFPGVPHRAYQVCGPDTKILYIIRNPIDRIISHHAHVFFKAGLSPDINIAVREVPDFLNFSRYAMQLAAWLDYFPAENIRVIQFEGYRHNRQATMDSIFRFLGLEPIRLQHPNAIYNSAEQRRLVSGIFYRITISKVYKAYLQRFMPRKIRLLAQALVTKPAPIPSTIEVSSDIRAWIEEQLREDEEKLAHMLGLRFPLWNSEGVAASWGEENMRAPLAD